MMRRRTAHLRRCASHVSSRGTRSGFLRLLWIRLWPGRSRPPGLVVREQRVDHVGVCVWPPTLYHDTSRTSTPICLRKVQLKWHDFLLMPSASHTEHVFVHTLRRYPSPQ